MSATEVLGYARSQGLDISYEGRRLLYSGPAGSMSNELRQALATHKPAILDLLEAERIASRRIVMCGECAKYISEPVVRRKSGVIWEIPGGCTEGRTSPQSHPPIYPSTGWYCDGWVTRASPDTLD